jgi:mono/diheme cytochrome c family protein
VETFSEMHYSQSFRMQEPPRLAPLANAVVFESTGDPDQVSKIPDKRERPYDAGVAGELYRVNCSVCHGLEGLGDGRAVRHITSGSSFYASEHDNSPYPTSPPNLVNSAAERFTSRDGMYGFVSSVQSFNPDSATNSVMPAFSKLLPEEDIRDIVNYIFDDTAGLSR